MFHVQLAPLGGILGPSESELGLFWPFKYIKTSPKRAKIALNLTSEGLRLPPEVRVEHKTCSTICGTPFQVILNQNNLTGLAGGVREGQNMAQNAARALNPMQNC